MIRVKHFVRGGVILKFIVGSCIFALGLAALIGYIVWSANHSVVSDPAKVVSLFQEVVPGAQPPPGYEGLVGADYRRTGRRDDEVKGTFCRAKDNPNQESKFARIPDEPTVMFTALSVPNDNNLASSVWDAKLKQEVRQGRDEIDSEPVSLLVGGKESEFQRIHSKDLDGKEYLEYKLTFEKNGRWNFLLISAPTEDFDEQVMTAFLEGLEPIE